MCWGEEYRNLGGEAGLWERNILVLHMLWSVVDLQQLSTSVEFSQSVNKPITTRMMLVVCFLIIFFNPLEKAQAGIQRIAYQTMPSYVNCMPFATANQDVYVFKTS